MNDRHLEDRCSWHASPAAEVVQRLEVDAAEGLSSAEAARRLERDGPNRLAEARREPRWRAFLRQFQDLLIIILLIAAVVSLVVTREWETPVVIALVVLLNATIGFVQESRAEASLDALRKMLVTTAAVRRDGRMVNLDAARARGRRCRRARRPGTGCPPTVGCWRRRGWRCRSPR